MVDFQNRAGSKPGAAGVASAQQSAVNRRERLRQLALDTIDLSKDPYFMRNHLGTFECKLCLTLHNTEGNYLAHTQGKRHQMNLALEQQQDLVLQVKYLGTQQKLQQTQAQQQQVLDILQTHRVQHLM